MMHFPPVRNGARDLLAAFTLKDFKVSWCGPYPLPNRIGFGSEDGEATFTDVDGVLLQAEPDKLVHSGEAINGMAFIKQWIAISTRREVAIFTLRSGQQPLVAEMPFGAHGVIAGVNGHFLAPLGPLGFMFTQPRVGATQQVTISSGRDESIYVYRLISVRAGSGQEIVACACRSGGVAALEFHGDGHDYNLSMIAFDGLDVVDLCPLSADDKPAGIAAIDKDGTVFLFHDALHDRKPAAIKYPDIKGIAYRLLSARGFLFVLTSEGFYAIAGLIERFLAGNPYSQKTPVLSVPMEAVDANLVGDWVVIVLPDEVARFDVDLLARITPPEIRHGEMREAQPMIVNRGWSRRDVPQLATAKG